MFSHAYSLNFCTNQLSIIALSEAKSAQGRVRGGREREKGGGERGIKGEKQAMPVSITQ